MKAAFSTGVLLLTSLGFAWNDNGHTAVVAVALELRPELKPKVAAILAEMPNSSQWLSVLGGGFKPGRSNPGAMDWIRSLTQFPERAGTLPDWMRDFQRSDDYSNHHYVNLRSDNGQYIDGRAIEMTNTYRTTLKMGDPGSKAWALAWLFHLVGDLHNPLHCATRMQRDGRRHDRGGNQTDYPGFDNLHQFWDRLPDNFVAGDPYAYARGRVATMKAWTPAEKSAFAKARGQMDPGTWAQEGLALIQKIGYPSDNLVSHYPSAAQKAADEKIFLAGARLADMLAGILEKSR